MLDLALAAHNPRPQGPQRLIRIAFSEQTIQSARRLNISFAELGQCGPFLIQRWSSGFHGLDLRLLSCTSTGLPTSSPMYMEHGQVSQAASSKLAAS